MLTAESIHPDLESILITESAIKRRIKRLSGEIKKVYGDEEITVISIINGAILFTADLLRQIDNPLRLDCIRVSSYGNKTKSVGTPQLIHSLTLDIANRQVLLIDDILDTGKTIKMVVGLIQKLKPASVRTCVLLDKHGRREVPFAPTSWDSRFRTNLSSATASILRNVTATCPASACSSRTCKTRPSGRRSLSGGFWNERTFTIVLAAFLDSGIS
jgi:hypoxanthine phosphoribosyltransferase